jgi:hypothetical protein
LHRLDVSVDRRDLVKIGKPKLILGIGSPAMKRVEVEEILILPAGLHKIFVFVEIFGLLEEA